MISRFKGKGGKKRLIEALRLQELVNDEEGLAGELAEILKLEIIEANTQFITEGREDADLFLIISGIVSVRINGREVARRTNRESSSNIEVTGKHTKSLI